MSIIWSPPLKCKFREGPEVFVLFADIFHSKRSIGSHWIESLVESHPQEVFSEYLLSWQQTPTSPKLDASLLI